MNALPQVVHVNGTILPLAWTTVPPSNPTTPDIPSSLTMDQVSINGTLLFTIGAPVVIPRNTRYQIVRTSVSSDPSVGTVVFDGDVLHAQVFAPSTSAYYFARGYVSGAGSTYYGSYYPGSVGVLADPTRNVLASTSTNSQTISDKQFVDITSFTPDFLGQAHITAAIDGKASFDKDSGTFFTLAICPSSYVDTGLGIPIISNPGSATTDGISGFFTTNSNHQFVTLNGIFTLQPGVSYNLGIYCRRTSGTLTFYAENKSYYYVRA